MHFYTCAERNVALNDLTQRLQYSRKALSITTTNEALELYRKVLDIDPENKTAKRQIRQLKRNNQNSSQDSKDSLGF